jgi:hypothetical protein
MVYATRDTEKQARTKLAEKVRRVREGQAPARRVAATFEEYAEQIIREREGVGDRTRDKYRTDLRLYLEPTRICGNVACRTRCAVTPTPWRVWF